MPSKHSERLKQAIDYIRAGEKEIAREIILEIIQADPDYEKAWIWLVETVPDRANKVDILKTRLEQYPETSPFSRIALDKIAPEVLDNYIPPSEAIIYPPGMEPHSEATEDEIQYNVSINDDDHEQFRLEDEELITFEEPEESSPFETSDSGVLRDIQALEEDAFYAEPAQQTPDPEDVDFNLFEDIEGEELQEDDLDFFSEIERENPAVISDAEEDDEDEIDSWLETETDNSQSVDSVDDLANLLNDDTSFEDDDMNDDYGVFGIQDEDGLISTGTSDPFILDESSKQILGSEVVDQANIESQSLDDLFRNASTGDLTPTTGFLGDMTFPESEHEGQSTTPISQEDISAASDNFRESVLADSISTSRERQKAISQQIEKEKEIVKTKKKDKNATFIFGCSIMAAILFFSLIAMGYLVLQYANNPQVKAITVTASPTSTITPSVTVPVQAPWLKDDEDAEQTPEPGGSEIELPTPEANTSTGLNGRTQQQWVSFFKSYTFQCSSAESFDNTISQECEYQDDAHTITAVMSGSETMMPEKIEFSVLANETEELISSTELNALLTDTLAPLVTAPIDAESQQEAAQWFVKEAKNLVLAGQENMTSETFGDETISLEFTYFLKIEL